MSIRAFRSCDEPGRRRCFVELQDHEDAFDPTVATGVGRALKAHLRE